MAKIAVILPSFNRPKYVSVSIKSVLDQTFVDWKLYIMDNSSSNMLPTMQQIYSQYPDKRIVVDHTEIANGDRPLKALAIVTNKALFTLSEKEPYVVIGADDDIMMPNKLEVLSTFLDTHPEANMVSGILEIMNANGMVAQSCGGANARSAANYLNWLQPMYRRELLDKTGMLPMDNDSSAIDHRFFTMLATHTDYCYGIPMVLDRTTVFTSGGFHPWTVSTAPTS
jgi:glycosyltransferase involved in cell wall biosynthesis